LTTGEIAAHFDQIYGASVSKETISRITDKVIEEMQTWSTGPSAARHEHRLPRPMRRHWLVRTQAAQIWHT